MDDTIDPTQLIWDEKFAIGIKSFDDQHHHLIKIMNELHAEYTHANIHVSRLNPIAKELVDFTVYSLDYESDCLAQFGFTDLLLHLEQHELFKEKTNWFKDKLAADLIDSKQLQNITQNIWKFLYLWLYDHINICDKKYATLLLQNGIK